MNTPLLVSLRETGEVSVRIRRGVVRFKGEYPSRFLASLGETGEVSLRIRRGW